MSVCPMTDTFHYMPINDLIGHVANDDCLCGPTPELMQRRTGDAWLYVHHSLDGREVRHAETH